MTTAVNSLMPRITKTITFSLPPEMAAKPMTRSVADAKPQGPVQADAPGRKVPPPLGAVPKLPGVEPGRRRE